MKVSSLVDRILTPSTTSWLNRIAKERDAARAEAAAFRASAYLGLSCLKLCAPGVAFATVGFWLGSGTTYDLTGLLLFLTGMLMLVAAVGRASGALSKVGREKGTEEVHAEAAIKHSSEP